MHSVLTWKISKPFNSECLLWGVYPKVIYFRFGLLWKALHGDPLRTFDITSCLSYACLS